MVHKIKRDWYHKMESKGVGGSEGGGCVPTSARLEDAVETGDEHSKLVLQGVTQRADHGRDGLFAHHTGQTRVVSEQEPVGLNRTYRGDNHSSIDL